jgi:CheY-like chemotaxis protein
MVVDDHIDDRTHAKDLLVADGQFVTDAPDAIECVRIMKEAAAANEYYDVILLDYDMPPFMWGDRAANLLRMEGYDGLIIGLVDEEASETVIRRFLTNGGDAVIPKPLHLDALREELASLQVGQGAGDVPA